MVNSASLSSLVGMGSKKHNFGCSAEEKPSVVLLHSVLNSKIFQLYRGLFIEQKTNLPG